MTKRAFDFSCVVLVDSAIPIVYFRFRWIDLHIFCSFRAHEGSFILNSRLLLAWSSIGSQCEEVPRDEDLFLSSHASRYFEGFVLQILSRFLG